VLVDLTEITVSSLRLLYVASHKTWDGGGGTSNLAIPH